MGRGARSSPDRSSARTTGRSGGPGGRLREPRPLAGAPRRRHRRGQGKVKAFAVAVPSWGVGVGGTRFAKFPIPGEPTGIFEKLEDCAVVQALGRAHARPSRRTFPWDKVADSGGAEGAAPTRSASPSTRSTPTPSRTSPARRCPTSSARSPTPTPAVRDQAVAHNLDCIEIGEPLGSKAITVWVADGSNFPGQADMTGALDRYLDSMARIYAALPADWRIFIEHKLYEPAFYSTVISDWGTTLLCAQPLGDKAQCLVDLGHHAPNVNIEQIVARLARFGKLGGFHFNDSQVRRRRPRRRLDQPAPAVPGLQRAGRGRAARPERASIPPTCSTSRTTSPTRSRACCTAPPPWPAPTPGPWWSTATALAEHQEANDVIMAFHTLRRAYDTDVAPDPRHGPLRGRRRDRPDRRLPRQRLADTQGAGAQARAGGPGGDRLRAADESDPPLWLRLCLRQAGAAGWCRPLFSDPRLPGAAGRSVQDAAGSRVSEETRRRNRVFADPRLWLRLCLRKSAAAGPMGQGRGPSWTRAFQARRGGRGRTRLEAACPRKPAAGIASSRTRAFGFAFGGQPRPMGKGRGPRTRAFQARLPTLSKARLEAACPRKPATGIALRGPAPLASPLLRQSGAAGRSAKDAADKPACPRVRSRPARARPRRAGAPVRPGRRRTTGRC